MPRVFFFGIDGMPPQWVLDQWLPDLPNFRKLTESGTFGRILSTVPPTSIAAWTSIFSGCDPGQHGITGYIRRPHPPRISMDLVDATRIKVPLLWDYLGNAGKRSIVLNVPLSYPVRPINGSMISGLLTPGFDERSYHPAELKGDIERVLGGPYRFDISDFGSYRQLEREEIVRRVEAFTAEHFRWVEHQLAEQWDLFAFVTVGGDRLHHSIWRYLDPAHPNHERHPVLSDAIRRYYQRIDAWLGTILDRLGGDTTIIVSSDHGMGAMSGRINLNDWLIREGYLVLNDDFAREIQHGPKKLDLTRVNWEKTRAFGMGAYEALLYLYPEKGSVSSAEYDALMSELAEKIAAISGPNGESIRTIVHRVDRLYGDAALAEAPDGVVYFDGLQMGSNCDVGNSGLYSWANTVGLDDALHTPEGTFIISGPGVPPRALSKPISVTDITPTILAVFGIPADPRMRGKSVV